MSFQCTQATAVVGANEYNGHNVQIQFFLCVRPFGWIRFWHRQNNMHVQTLHSIKYKDMDMDMQRQKHGAG